MLNPEKIKQEEKPDIIQQLGDGTYYYNYNIQPVKLTKLIKDKETEIDGWEYIQAYIFGNPESKACIKALIRKYVSQEEEFDLINSYNNAIINNNLKSADIIKYKDYLKLINNIKEEVNSYFNN